MEMLQHIGALDRQKALTSLGKVLLQLPVEAAIGKLVLYGCFFRCLDPALTLAAVLSNRDPFMSPLAVKEEANAIKNSWSPGSFRSDPLAVVCAFNSWWDIQKKGHYQPANRFAQENFLSKPTLVEIAKIKEQIYQSLHSLGLIDIFADASVRTYDRRKGSLETMPSVLNTNSTSTPMIAALIALSSSPNFAIATSTKTLRTAIDRVSTYFSLRGIN